MMFSHFRYFKQQFFYEDAINSIQSNAHSMTDFKPQRCRQLSLVKTRPGKYYLSQNKSAFNIWHIQTHSRIKLHCLSFYACFELNMDSCSDCHKKVKSQNCFWKSKYTEKPRVIPFKDNNNNKILRIKLLDISYISMSYQ